MADAAAGSAERAGDTAPLLMVGISGMRGVLGRGLTPGVLADYAGVLGHWLGEHRPGHAQADRPRVVVGRDGRAGSEVVARAVLAGLTGAGCDVFDLGVAMTPTVGVMVDAEDAAGGVVITASHNPQPWNGVKCLVRTVAGTHQEVAGSAACAPKADDAAELVRRFEAGESKAVAWDQVGRVINEPIGAEVHLGRVMDRLGDRLVEGIRQNGYRVVLDSANASGAEAGRRLLDALDCRVLHLGDELHGVFGREAEPTAANLEHLSKSVREYRGAVGFAQDPDGDRLAMIDETGKYIGEEYTLALAAESVLRGLAEDGLLAAHTDFAIATNLSTSRMIDDVASSYGVRVQRTAVGEANVVEAMKPHARSFGGEGNGGVIWPDITYVRDSLGAMALVLALMARTGKSLSELVRAIDEASPSGLGYAIVKRKVGLKAKADAVPALDALAQKYGSERVDRQDGVRIDFDRKGAWLHVRPSNTEPILRLIAEAGSEVEAESLLDEAGSVVGG
ncbi:MAG: phosphoglucosamine mutase [Planctomycetota bacterium]